MGQLISPKLYQSGPSRLWHLCPGCNEMHPIPIRTENEPNNWVWSGGVESPTFNPSFGQHAKNGYCHYFITRGKILFLNDCFHQLAGQTVEIPDCPVHDDGGLVRWNPSPEV